MIVAINRNRMTLFVNLTKFEQVQGTAVWIFQDFSVTQILHEFKIGKSGVSNSALFNQLIGPAYLHFLKSEIYQMNKI